MNPTQRTISRQPYQKSALWGFIISLISFVIIFLAPVAFVMSLIGYRKIKTTNNRGRNLALAGMILPVLQIILSFTLLSNNNLYASLIDGLSESGSVSAAQITAIKGSEANFLGLTAANNDQAAYEALHPTIKLSMSSEDFSSFSNDLRGYDLANQKPVWVYQKNNEPQEGKSSITCVLSELKTDTYFQYCTESKNNKVVSAYLITDNINTAKKDTKEFANDQYRRLFFYELGPGSTDNTTSASQSL